MTINFSRHGILISAAQPQIPLRGSKLHVAVEWPVPLGGKTPLQFVVRGKVMRAGPTTFALLYERYDFHITKPRPALLQCCERSSAREARVIPPHRSTPVETFRIRL